MAMLTPQVITQRRLLLSHKILALWQPLQGQDWYTMMCPCDIDYGHMPVQEVPRLRLPTCHFPGEMDYFFVRQPFLQQYGFRVRWHCDECHREMSCGAPRPIDFHAVLANQG